MALSEVSSAASSSKIQALLLLCVLLARAAGAAEVPALFAFGDSLADDGNNNFLNTVAKANFPPYGSQFDTGKPTGRFTNGRNQIDFLASRLGLPLIPPFMDPSTRGDKLLYGVNFASAGSGILDITNINAGQLIPITQQVKNFARVREELISMLGYENATQLISGSIFCVLTGNNDYTMTFPFLALGGSSSQLRFQSLLISKLLEQTRELYMLGARKFVIAGVGAVGCAPSQIDRYNTRSCVQFLNKPVMRYNRALSKALRELNKELPEATFVYSDLYLQMITLIRSPAAYGFKYVAEPCCGLKLLQNLCAPGVPVCRDVSEYLFWDSYHPSSKTYDLLVGMLYSSGPPYNIPFSVDALVHI